MMDRKRPRMISFAFAAACVAVVMLLIGDADGGLFCGRRAQRRAERRAARMQTCQMAHANNMQVTQYSQPIASYRGTYGGGSCTSCGCANDGASVTMHAYSQPQPQNVSYYEKQPTYSYDTGQVVTYSPTVPQASMTWSQIAPSGGGQCRMVNGRWQCGG